MATVRQMLDDLHSGKTSLEQTVAMFRARTWPPAPKPASEAQTWGVADDDDPGDDTWQTVQADSSLTGTQYQTLARAYGQAIGAVI